MSIISSLFNAAGGLGAHAEGIAVTGDNISNVNTVGFKASRGNFQDILAGAAVGGLGSIGQGVRMASIEQLFTQGALLSTGVATDLAIRGDGFFMVRGNSSGINGTFYTRAGQFHIDADGYLVNPDGLRLQGRGTDTQGQPIGLVGDLRLGVEGLPPRATTAVEMVANLDAAAPVPPAFDPADPSGTSSFSTTVNVFDSLGRAHTVNVFFRNQGDGAWEWHAMVDGGEVTGGVAGTPVEVAAGTLGFTTDGALDTETTLRSDFDFAGATQDQQIEFDFGDSITSEGGSGLAGSTSFASPSAASFIDQDGYGSGALVAVNIAEDGAIAGTFTNGLNRTLGQVMLARFHNVRGLQRMGNNLYGETQVSGEALIGGPRSGGLGVIAAGSLEQSNVDLARELIALIALQRGFQANSKTITTSSEMLEQLVNIKR